MFKKNQNYFLKSLKNWAYWADKADRSDRADWADWDRDQTFKKVLKSDTLTTVLKNENGMSETVNDQTNF